MTKIKTGYCFAKDCKKKTQKYLPNGMEYCKIHYHMYIDTMKRVYKYASQNQEEFSENVGKTMTKKIREYSDKAIQKY